jgi:plastocyanin
MNKTLIIVLVVVILIIGAFFLFGNKSTAPTVQDTQQTPNTTNNNVTPAPSVTQTTTTGNTKNAVTVTYTDNGFSPQTITIKKGDIVTFVNKSSIGMWVASNPHPVHTDYPGFDEKAAVGNGGSWSFTFDVVGTHGYHNHKNPSTLGTVVVE